MLKDDSIKTEGIITERVLLSDVVKGGFEELVAHNDRTSRSSSTSPGSGTRVRLGQLSPRPTRC